MTSCGWAEIENVKKIQTFGFSISALPPDGTFQMSLHFLHLWNVGQKRVIQIFERWCINRVIKAALQSHEVEYSRQLFLGCEFDMSLWLNPQNFKRFDLTALDLQEVRNCR